ncbi:MAG: FkbM family methyltransferase [Desertifilum sp.]|nr:FkbM family methyltransferase [Desertifilum sp.]
MMSVTWSEWLKMRWGLLTHPQFYRNPLAAFWRRLIWKGYAQHQSRLNFLTEYGFLIEANPQDMGIGSLFYRGQYEWAELQLWRTFLVQPNLTVIDIGANVGLYSLTTAAHCRQHGLSNVKIYGFEPNPYEYSKFQQNIAINDYQEIQVLPFAMSDRAGVCQMSIPPTGMGMLSRLLTDELPQANASQTLDVKTITLDEWCNQQGIQKIDLLKLDVEGHELNVLLGSQNLLETQAIQVLFMEVGHGQWQKTIDLLEDYGYRIERVCRNGSLIPFNRADITGWSNVIARAKSG